MGKSNKHDYFCTVVDIMCALILLSYNTLLVQTMEELRK